MTTDDRDAESQNNPSTSFKVGEVDRLSGFFTPVWESKRRLRAGSPIPASSAAASAPSSARGGEKPHAPAPASLPSSRGDVAAEPSGSAVPSGPSEARASASAASVHGGPAAAPPGVARPSQPPPPRPNRPGPAGAVQRGSADAHAARLESGALRASEARASEAHTSEARTPPGLMPAGLSSEALTPLESPHGERSASFMPAPPTQRDDGAASVDPGAIRAPEVGAPESSGAEGSQVAADARPTPLVPPVAPANGSGAVAVNDAETRALPLTAAAPISVRSVIPMPNTPGRPPARAKAPSSSPAVAPLASKQAGPHPSPEQYLDREPEFRAPAGPQPRRGGGSELQQRPLRGAPGPSALHEKLERRPPLDSVETFPRHRETESEREALQAAAARAAATPADPYPSQVLRTLRRTLHLSTPLPDAVRQMLEKYRY